MKYVKIFISVILLTLILAVPVFAKDDNEYDENLEKSGAYEMYDNLDDDTKDILSSLGINGISVEGIYNVSARKVIDAFIDVISGKITQPLKCIAVIVSIMLVLSISESFLQNGNENISSGNLVAVLLVVTAIASPAIKAISSAASNILVTTNFMISFIPVYAVLIASCGSPASALNFNTLLISAAEIIAVISKKIFMPLLSVFMGVNIASSINTSVCASKVSSIIKKAVTVTLGTVSALFTGFLSVKGNLAANVDAVALKGVKTVSGSVIPIIGSTLGEAYTSVLGSLALLKGSVGFFGILAVCAINIPIITELILWYFAMQICAVISGILGHEIITKLIESISNAIVIANTVIVFTAVVFIVSIGILIKVRAS